MFVYCCFCGKMVYNDDLFIKMSRFFYVMEGCKVLF